MDNQIKELLKRNSLSITEGRVKILEQFLQSEGALAHADIEKHNGERFDRVTVYRTLQVFVEKGIIHTIPTADNSIRYALCKDECDARHHHDNHVHFICDECGKTVCLDDVTVPAIALPATYQAAQVQMIVNGTCDECFAPDAKRKGMLIVE